MLHKILDYLEKKSKNFNYSCDIFGNYIYNTQSDGITRLKKVDDNFVLGTSERGNDTIKLIFKDREEALLTTLLYLEKSRYFHARSELLNNDINDVITIMEQAKRILTYASPELNLATDNNYYVEKNSNNYQVIFKTNNKKYKILNTDSDEIWAYQVALNYSLELDNYYYINKELIENDIISKCLGEKFLYQFLELSKYESVNI